LGVTCLKNEVPERSLLLTEAILKFISTPIHISRDNDEEKENDS
jgi:hypothetical protein